jgi:hypothetical protein
MACKSDIAIDLIDNRISLREAAVAFRAANADNPRFVAIMRLKYPNASEQELQARNAIDFAMGLLDSEPRRSEIRARFAAELEVLRHEAVMDAN